MTRSPSWRKNFIQYGKLIVQMENDAQINVFDRHPVLRKIKIHDSLENVVRRMHLGMSFGGN